MIKAKKRESRRRREGSSIGLRPALTVQPCGYGYAVELLEAKLSISAKYCPRGSVKRGETYAFLDRGGREGSEGVIEGREGEAKVG